MKKFVLLSVVAALAVAVPATANAASTFNHPFQAKSVKNTLVTAHDQCVAPTPVNPHQGGIAVPVSCVPPVASGALKFGPKGKGDIAIQVIKGDVKLTLKGADVLKVSDGLPYSGDGYAIATIRITDNYCSPDAGVTRVDCTVPDVPFTASSATACVVGKCSIKTTANAQTADAAGVGRLGNVEIGQVSVGKGIPAGGDKSFRSGIYIP